MVMQLTRTATMLLPRAFRVSDSAITTCLAVACIAALPLSALLC